MNVLIRKVVPLLAAVVALELPGADVVKRVKADFADYGSRPFVHYAVPAMSEEQRLPDAYPADGKANAPVKIFAAKGEYEPGAFNVWGVRDLGKVRFELSEFKRDQGSGIGDQGGVVFPKENLDLKLVKCWYQNLNGWFSYFSDSGDWKLCPELLVNDEDLIRCDEKKKANYAKIVGPDGKVREQWINPPRLMSTFQPMAPGFEDAAELKPVKLPKEQFRNFFLTVKTTKDTPAGVYRGSVALTDAKGAALGRIPVEIHVADYELPHPKCYREPERDFLVCFYHYLGLHNIVGWNGGDMELAARQLKPILRDCAEHGQTLHCSGQHFSPTMFHALETSIEVGMRPDVFMISPLLYSKDDEARRESFRCANELDRRYGHHNAYFLWWDEPGLGFETWYRKNMEEWKPAGFKFSIAGEECVYRKIGYTLDWQNIAFDPTIPSHLRDCWNKQPGSRVAWYARQHVGAENPALHRRQNGLGAWLTGYNSLYNYAHHLGPYNDDSDIYKPMVYAYGTYNGVIDTIAWEGFREGIDDIRYATLLAELARKAQASSDLKVRDLGGLAFQYLSLLDPATYDSDTCRAEMRRYIDRLLAVAKPDPVVPFKRLAPKPAAADAALKAELAAAKTDGERVKAYQKHFRWDEAISVWEKGGNLTEAVRAAEQNLDFARVDKLREKIVRDANRPVRDRAMQAWALAFRHPELWEDKEVAKLLETVVEGRTNNYVSAWNMYGCLQTRFNATRCAPSWKKAYRLVAKVADSAGIKGMGSVAARYGIEIFAADGDYKAVNEVAARFLSGEKLKPAERYAFGLYAKLFGAPIKKPLLLGTRETAVGDLVGDYEKEALTAEITTAQRVEAINNAGQIANALRDDEMVRGLEAYRASLYKPQERRRYTVKFSEKPLLYAQDVWEDVEGALCDRKYGGSTELMDSDVSTGGRAVASGKETLPPMTMKVAADDWGVHFRFIIPDPKARQIEARQIDGGSFEGYLAPGKNRPYVCFLKDDTGADWRFFNTVYAAYGQQPIDGKDQDRVKTQIVFEDDAMVQMMSLSWDNFVDDLPQDGSVWDFEPLHWGRAGSSSWNGVKTIHGRSTWGELVFDLSDGERARILRGVEARAYARFRREVTKTMRIDRYEGAARHWKDPVVGDPEFYEAKVKPFVEPLLETGKLLAEDPSDKTIFRLEENGTLTKWHNIFFALDRMRYDWLTK